MDTTTEMMAYLQQLRAKVAQLEQQGGSRVSDSDEEDDVQSAGHESHLTLPLRVMERTVTYTNGDTYKGSMLGDQRHGPGTHTTSTGDVYEGSWQYDQRHGQGTFRAASGMVYEGSWVDDKATGSGRCTYPDGSSYEGDWQADERSGWGTLATADGQTYEGEWEANAPHGEGQWTFADGLSHFRGTYKAGQRVEGQLMIYDSTTKKPSHTYTGRFKANLRDGPDGVGVQEGMWVYRGDWKEDSRWGEGHCRYTDGSVYEGQWLRDMRHGNGCMTLPDGTVYEGQWKDGKLHGAGKVKYASGEAYIGYWQNGERHGQGKWSSAPKGGFVLTKAATAVGTSSGTVGSSSSSSSSRDRKEVREIYVGSWVAGKREGHGVADYADGGRYEGQWKAGKRDGQGLMVFADGTVFRGAWEEDEWLQSAAEPALCRMTGPGLQGAVAGQKAEFVIQARDELSNPRLNGGDAFQVLLVPKTSPHDNVSSGTSSSTSSRSKTHTPVLLTGPASTLQSDHPPLGLTPPSDNVMAAGPGVAASTAQPMSHPVQRTTSSGSASSSSSSGASVGMEAYCSAGTTSGAAAVFTSRDCMAAVHTEIHATSTSMDETGAVLHMQHSLYCRTAASGVAAGTAAGTAAPITSSSSNNIGGPVLEAVAVGDVQDNGDGTYSCSYRYQVAGTYELHVTNGEGEHVAGSPCTVHISAGPPSARHATVAGSGRSTAVAGSKAEFTVTFRDAFGNPCCNKDTGHGSQGLALEARLIGSNTITAAVADNVAMPDGSYSCTYMAPAAPGLYVLEVTADGKHVGGGPFSVRVMPASSQSLSAAAAARAAASADNTTSVSTATATLSSGHTSNPTSLSDERCHNPTSNDNNSSTVPSITDNMSNATGSVPAAAAGVGVQDKVRWWGDVAKQAYEATDGCLQGFEDTVLDTTADGVVSGMSPSEAEMVKANPSLPVVERLEDLWLLSRLQQERKAAQQQQQQQQQERTAKLQQQQRGKHEQPSGYTSKAASVSGTVTEAHMAVSAASNASQQPDSGAQVAKDACVSSAAVIGTEPAAPASWLYDLD